MAKLVKSNDDYPRDTERVHSDPPFVAGGFGYGYDGSLANVKGRFCYLRLKKRF